LHGVASDVILPSLSDLPEFGEGALKNALAYDEVAKARYTKWSDSHSLFIDQLRRRSEERVENDPEFHYVIEDIGRLRHKLDENRISLNEDARKKELQDDKLRKETRSKERLARNQEEPRIYRVTLDTVDKPNLQLIMYPGKLAEAKKNGVAPKVDPEAASDADSDLISGGDTQGDGKEPTIDPERDETVNILTDLVDLSRGINGRFFAVPLRVTAADQIRICIGSGLRVKFWRNAILLRLGQFPRIHDQLKIRLINRVECYPVNSRFLLIPRQTFFGASFFAQFIVLK